MMVAVSLGMQGLKRFHLCISRTIFRLVERNRLYDFVMQLLESEFTGISSQHGHPSCSRLDFKTTTESRIHVKCVTLVNHQKNAHNIFVNPEAFMVSKGCG